jgi:hypothetical protein
MQASRSCDASRLDNSGRTPEIPAVWDVNHFGLEPAVSTSSNLPDAPSNRRREAESDIYDRRDVCLSVAADTVIALSGGNSVGCPQQTIALP